jgi:hypothetical protein
MRLTALALLLCLAALGWTVMQPSLLPIAAPVSEGAAEAEAPRPLSTIPLADVHPWGANFFLEREVELWKQELTATMARDAGLRFAKQHLLWSEVERTPGSYDWQKYDRIVSLLRDAGMEVVLRVDWPPQWATEGFDAGANGLPRDMDDYARFVGAVAEHFTGRVRFIQVWNEPNLSSEWGWRPVDAAAYVDMLARAAEAARAANPDVVILAAPLAINNEDLGLHGNESDLTFLRKMYEAGAADHFDVLAANAFGMERSPEDAPAPDRLNFRRTELQRQIMREFDDDTKAVWFSEYGWNAAPSDIEDNIWGRVEESVQADWTVEGVRYAEEHWPWAGVFGIWYFRRERFRGAFADSYFQMLSVDFVAQRVYDAVREDATRGDRLLAGPGGWQERSAPVRLERLGDWSWQRLAGASDGHGLVAVNPEATLRMRFRGREVHARMRQGAQAGGLRVNVDGRDLPVRSLKEGRGWADVALATELSDGEHELRIAPWRAGGEVAIDSFRVGAGVAQDRPPLAPLLLGGLCAILSVLLLVDVRRAMGRARL